MMLIKIKPSPECPPLPKCSECGKDSEWLILFPMAHGVYMCEACLCDLGNQIDHQIAIERNPELRGVK